MPKSMSESTIAIAAVDRDATERWEDEGGRALAVNGTSSRAGVLRP
jgi:hypothetical protein